MSEPESSPSEIVARPGRRQALGWLAVGVVGGSLVTAGVFKVPSWLKDVVNNSGGPSIELSWRGIDVNASDNSMGNRPSRSASR